MHTYDIIIIGSGLSGLMCGAILSKEGYSVCVLEKNAQTGGCFQGFKRFGRTLDTGIHYIGSLDKGEILHRCFTHLGIMDKINLIRLDENNFDQVCLHDKSYPYAMGNELFIDTLAKEFPKEKANLQRYINNIASIAQTISPDVLNSGKISAATLDMFAIPAWKTIAETTQNEQLQRVLSNPAMLYGGDKAISTFYIHAMTVWSYLHGSYRFVGSSMQLTDALRDLIQHNGGTVRTKAEVDTIHCNQHGAVDGVTLKNGERITATYIISTLHPLVTLRMTEKTTNIRKAYLTRLASLTNSYGFFTTYLIKKKNSTLYQNKNFYLYDKAYDAWQKTSFPNDNSVKSVMVSMKPTVGNQLYTDTVELLTPMRYTEVEQWSNTRYERRGDDYQLFKAQKAQELIQFAKQFIPDIDNNTEHIITTTPLSYRDYTGSPEGSAYGIMKNYRNPLATIIPTRSKVKNMFFAGQNVNMHGVLGVALTALLNCSEFVGEAYLAKKIGNVY